MPSSFHKRIEKSEPEECLISKRISKISEYVIVDSSAGLGDEILQLLI
jgi:hypothetical protein